MSKDLSDIIGKLIKTVLETTLNGELESHLGYQKNEKAPTRKFNTRNCYIEKTLKTEKGELMLKTPRDCGSSFEPQY